MGYWKQGRSVMIIIMMMMMAVRIHALKSHFMTALPFRMGMEPLFVRMYVGMMYMNLNIMRSVMMVELLLWMAVMINVRLRMAGLVRIIQK